MGWCSPACSCQYWVTGQGETSDSWPMHLKWDLKMSHEFWKELSRESWKLHFYFPVLHRVYVIFCPRCCCLQCKWQQDLLESVTSRAALIVWLVNGWQSLACKKALQQNKPFPLVLWMPMAFLWCCSFFESCGSNPGWRVLAEHCCLVPCQPSLCFTTHHQILLGHRRRKQLAQAMSSFKL